MIEKIVLVITLLLFSVVLVIVGRAVVKKQSIFGRPPIPVFYFILAKMLVLVNLVFLLLKGLNVQVPGMFNPVVFTDLFAVGLLSAGTIILVLSVVQLNNDLIFGLSDSDHHKLQTKGIYSVSRHPFYLGFLFILLSSCLFIPNLINVASFTVVWVIHHFIMIKEEEHLCIQYGDEYKQYLKNVGRYITF
jgi:protein-S-isoprenylcysteine O-methyltransferase Ste14